MNPTEFKSPAGQDGIAVLPCIPSTHSAAWGFSCAKTQ